MTVEQRIVEAAAVLPAYGGVTGWAGLRWCGAAWIDGTRRGGRELRDVTLAIGVSSIRPQRGIATSQERLSPTDIMTHRGLRVTSTVQALFFELRYARSDGEAVQAADMTAYADLVSAAELVEYVAAHPAYTGVERARLAAREMDENAWSPTESAMRRVWERDAGLPRPLSNRPVFDTAGHHLGTPDLLDPVRGVAGEYNGALHLDGHQRAKDLERERRFRTAGLEYVEMVAADLPSPFAFVARLRAAYARAGRVPLADRQWTVQLPPWWLPTFTVDQRRQLDHGQRRRLLKLRLRAG